jgi:hypothetical protein
MPLITVRHSRPLYTERSDIVKVIRETYVSVTRASTLPVKEICFLVVIRRLVSLGKLQS